MAKFKPTYVYPFKFYKLPRATQIIFLRLKALADKYARIDFNTGIITYHERSVPKKVRTIDKREASRIFNDLYEEFA